VAKTFALDKRGRTFSGSVTPAADGKCAPTGRPLDVFAQD